MLTEIESAGIVYGPWFPYIEDGRHGRLWIFELSQGELYGPFKSFQECITTAHHYAKKLT